jgi:hypothetical protein
MLDHVVLLYVRRSVSKIYVYMFQEIDIQEGPPQPGTSRVQPTAHSAGPTEEDDDVVEVEESGAVKVEQGEQSFDYSNDGTDVSSYSILLWFQSIKTSRLQSKCLIMLVVRLQWGEGAYGNEGEGEYYEEGAEADGQYEEGGEGYSGGDEQPQNIPSEIAPDVSGNFHVNLPPVFIFR